MIPPILITYVKAGGTNLGVKIGCETSMVEPLNRFVYQYTLGCSYKQVGK